MSPETLSSHEWSNILSSDTYSENLIGFIIDEVHCIKNCEFEPGVLILLIILNLCNRGESFRTEFSHLGETRNIVPEGVCLMTLTATATLSTRKYYIIKNLSMQNPVVMYMASAR